MADSKYLLSFAENHSIANDLHRIRFGTSPKLKISSGSSYIKKDGKTKGQGGEDGHFICAEKNTIGLADGVVAGEYAREFMNNAYNNVYYNYNPKRFIDPYKVMSSSYSCTKLAGASTACIITVKNNFLYVANLGNSGFIVYRKGDIVFRSPLQQYEFDHPLQLGNKGSCVRPASAMKLKIEVENGDIIVAGTDGLFDNMFSSEIKQILDERTATAEIEAAELANTIANHARRNSYDRSKESPYSKSAKTAGEVHIGGKIDDITVIVSHIVPI